MGLVQISDHPVELSQEFSLVKLKSKQVVSKSGDILGKVKDVIVRDYAIIGILISKRFQPDLYVDKKFFDSFREEAVVLSIDPVTCIIGLDVLDSSGKKIGKVSRIVRESSKNVFSRFIVKRGLFARPLELHSTDIKTVSQSVILKMEVD